MACTNKCGWTISDFLWTGNVDPIDSWIRMCLKCTLYRQKRTLHILENNFGGLEVNFYLVLSSIEIRTTRLQLGSSIGLWNWAKYGCRNASWQKYAHDLEAQNECDYKTIACSFINMHFCRLRDSISFDKYTHDFKAQNECDYNTIACSFINMQFRRLRDSM